MRHILVDRARAKASVKRGENPEVVEISTHGLEVAETTLDERVLMVDEMMKRLELNDPESVRVISLMYDFATIGPVDALPAVDITEDSPNCGA